MKRKILSVTLLLFVFSNKLLIAQAGMWTWMKGDSTCCSSGTWGIQGLSDASNNPPALYNPASWTDHDGNFWLFGGSKGNNTYSALWKFNVLTNEWTWINGSQLPNQCGVYGVIGVPSPDNSPGARGAALLSWTDTNGDLWLYDLTSKKWTQLTANGDSKLARWQ